MYVPEVLGVGYVANHDDGSAVRDKERVDHGDDGGGVGTNGEVVGDENENERPKHSHLSCFLVSEVQAVPFESKLDAVVAAIRYFVVAVLEECAAHVGRVVVVGHAVVVVRHVVGHVVVVLDGCAGAGAGVGAGVGGCVDVGVKVFV
eukprot:m.49219 g.49219  ORF g.49219 m.49219 type:complete len:147 (+) comp7442_c0_seq1:1460-1900(+)